MSLVQIEVKGDNYYPGPDTVILTDAQIVNKSIVFTTQRTEKTNGQNFGSVPRRITVNIDDIMALVKQT